MKGAYYNEFDPVAALWLEELIKAGLIAPGDVDTRSIEDVKPDDLSGYKQCHFFAGIGIWSLALREAGWGDDRPIWTGSCPCQPFSAAGKGAGFADERHLWPAFHHLIDSGRPEHVIGEQVASKDGLAWLDLVQTDMENTDYTFGAVDTCAAGFGAPHIRQRLYWVADTMQPRWPERGAVTGRGSVASSSSTRELADAGQPGLAQCERIAGISGRESRAVARQTTERAGIRSVGRLAHPHGGNACTERQQRSGEQRQQPQDRGDVEWVAHSEHSVRRAECQTISETHRRDGLGGCCDITPPGPVNGLWRHADWLGCRDGKWRPVEPGTFPLVDGRTLRNRVAELRGSGNALNLAQAKGFIEAAFGTNGRGGVT